MAEKKFLDLAGLNTFWGKVSERIATAKTEVGADVLAQVDNKIQALGAVLSFKGVVANVNALPNESNKQGDVYHITADSSEYVWDGAQWEELGTAVDLSGYYDKASADAKFATPANVTAGVNQAKAYTDTQLADITAITTAEINALFA